MTEAEWLLCTNPDTLLSHLQKKGERKYLLFAVACCRLIWHLLTDERCRHLVEVVERRIEQQRRTPGARTGSPSNSWPRIGLPVCITCWMTAPAVAPRLGTT